ncbi:MAG: NAD(P)/FAD-dependent oxidoreductase [Blastocatellia bacterium]|nr:NAD(P)/FAD-dependent oxidoreductase [Blastocatellia bacterium]
MNFDAIIIGGGAAGLFCAITAGRRGKRVLVIEHNAEVGRKILISGGGRCNFTNKSVSHENFLSQNPHFCKSALAGFSPQDFVELVRKHKIPYYEKTLGQLFCRESSRQIVDMLLTECRRSKVRIATRCRVESVRSPHVSEGSGERGDFVISTSNGDLSAPNLIIACGGLSFPKIGATGFGYDVARQFGHKIVETRPSLVAMVLEKRAYPKLAGISLEAVADTGRAEFREKLLFTHRGVSGPVVIQASNYWQRKYPMAFDLAPGVDVADALAANRHSTRKTANFLAEFLPDRFAAEFLETSLADKQLAQLSNADIDAIGQKINNWQARFSATEGYDRAEVTLGGVSTDKVSSQTMESKLHSGLYFIGEVLDVTGWLGGYNFQWAWASGHAAGNSL